MLNTQFIYISLTSGWKNKNRIFTNIFAVTALTLSFGTLLEFLISWIVSAVIIYIALKIFPGKQQRENITGALIAALIGEIIFAFFNLIRIPFGNLLAIIVWLYALRKLFGVGWLGAAVIAILIYILSLIVSLIGLPHLL